MNMFTVILQLSSLVKGFSRFRFFQCLFQWTWRGRCQYMPEFKVPKQCWGL